MKSLIDKTYKGFMDAVDKFANCSTETPINKQKKIINNTSAGKFEERTSIGFASLTESFTPTDSSNSSDS